MSDREAGPDDVPRLAESMPHVNRLTGPRGNVIYQVGGRSFVFYRTPRPDAADPKTGERYPDVIMFWVASQEEKAMLLAQPDTPLFTTGHFDGHDSVLIRESQLGRLGLSELIELVQEAWLARASARRGRLWLAGQGLGP